MKMEDEDLKSLDSPSKKLKIMVIDVIIDNHDHIAYHNINFVRRAVKNLNTIADYDALTDSEVCQLEACLWLYTSMINRVHVTSDREEDFIAAQEEFIRTIGIGELKAAGYRPDEVELIADTILGIYILGDEDTRFQGILRDTLVMDFLGKQGEIRFRRFYQERVLNDAKLSLAKFYERIIAFLTEYVPITEYAKAHVKSGVNDLIIRLQKEQKKGRRKEDIFLKKELGIHEEELKQLRKSLGTIRGRDARGIQTLFRTTSQNHYTLNGLVDRKSNIMITVNSVILSVLISGYVGFSDSEFNIYNVSFLILATASFLSIIFAILAITPNKTHGTFTLDEVRKKNGNLLYYGNYHNMSFEDYEWGMLQKLNDGNYLYSSMIKDLYYLGLTLHRKFKNIRISLQIFLSGIIAAFISFVVIAIMNSHL